jgi:hypothetical protein
MLLPIELFHVCVRDPHRHFGHPTGPLRDRGGRSGPTGDVPDGESFRRYTFPRAPRVRRRGVWLWVVAT